MANAGDSNVVAVKEVDRILKDLYRVGAIGQVVENWLLWYHYGDKENTSKGLSSFIVGIFGGFAWMRAVTQ